MVDARVDEPTAAALEGIVEALRAALRAGDDAAAERLMGALALDAPERQLATLVPPEHLDTALAAYREVGPRTLRVLLALVTEEELATLPVRAWLAGDPAAPAGGEALTRAPELEPGRVVGYLGLALEPDLAPTPIEGTWVHLDGRWRCLGLARLLVPFAPTAQGLADGVRLGVALAGAERSVELRALTRWWRLPSPEAWLADALGVAAPEVAAELARLGEDLPGVLEWFARDRKTTLAARVLTNPFSAEATGLQRDVMLALRRPTPLGTVTASRDGDGEVTLWSWVVAGGAWRFVGKLRGLALPEPAPPAPARDFGPDDDGLRALLAHGVALAGHQQEAALAALAEGLRLPDPAATFARLVEPALAARLAADYERIGPLAQLFEGLARGSGLEVRVEAVAGPDDAAASSAQRALTLALRAPLRLLSARHSAPGGDDAQTTRSWAWLEGAWRFLGSTWGVTTSPAWATFVRRHLRYPAPEEPWTARFPETTDGLAALGRALFEATEQGDHTLRVHLFESLLLPDPARFAAEVFATPDAPYAGATGRAETITQALAGLRATLEDDLPDVFATPLERVALSGHALVTTRGEGDAPPTRGPWAMRRPVSLYALRLALRDRDDDPGRLLMPFVFEAGAWRLLGTLVHAESVVASHLFALLGQREP